jgi:NAD(P)-dependent dehydrogenase (short-subunit alcohol dehydrogenase family)
MKQVVVTGVSSGIGLSTARALLARGYFVFGSVRTDQDEERLSVELGPSFRALRFDVTDAEAVARAAARVREALGGENLAALVNNAGISRPGPLAYLPVEELSHQLEVNVVGLLQVTQAFLPLLGSRPGAPRPRGRIVNVSSNSGRIAYPFLGAYAASKHAVEGLSDALRRELLLYGIDVVLVQPGTTRTAIVEKTAQQMEEFLDSDYGPALERMFGKELRERQRSAIPVERVSRVILRAVESPRPRTRYPVPRKWLSGWIVPRLLPDRSLDRLVARHLGL